MNSSPIRTNDMEPDRSRLPAHVAIIMDGNGRWAKKQLLNRVKGHEKGSETVRTIVRTSREIGIRFLTLYAFSTENWQRPKTEVMALMALLRKFLINERKEMQENNIRLYAIGEVERLPMDVQAALQETMALTGANTGMQLNLALSYGARAEIVRAARSLAKEAAGNLISAESITSEMIASRLYTKDIPDPDLLIRTSGEMRISNFLLWQIAYAEIFITDTLWPDFGREEYLHILNDFQQRERRYGNVPA